MSRYLNKLGHTALLFGTCHRRLKLCSLFKYSTLYNIDATTSLRIWCIKGEKREKVLKRCVGGEGLGRIKKRCILRLLY